MTEVTIPERLRVLAVEEPGSVLLESAATGSAQGKIVLFRSPERMITAFSATEAVEALQAVDQAVAGGLYVAGYLAYEAGYAFEPTLRGLLPARAEEPLVWMGCYREPLTAEFRRPVWNTPESTPIVATSLSLTLEDYGRNLQRVRELIAAGETYQANLTLNTTLQTNETPLALYERLLRVQPVNYAAIVHPSPDWHVLSLSPELFFAREGRSIRTKPMKGTAPRGMDLAEDRANAAWLAADEKNRSENVMIVDLLRSDLGQLCEMGSIQVTKLFEVERFPSVMQMTSTVDGVLREGISYASLFRALFPSGSIVGAPKINTMRLLSGLEHRPRGVYTGAIGFISPDSRAAFNVAIRTVSLRGQTAVMGVGSGIVSDSSVAAEYTECLTKAGFLRDIPHEKLGLIETLLFEHGQYVFGREHLERIAASAEYFDIPFDGMVAEQRLNAVVAHAPERMRVRLLLDSSGDFTVSGSGLANDGDQPVTLMLAHERMVASDRFLRHKTTFRAVYDEAYARAQSKGYTDALFCNVEGEITEGAIHNVIAILCGEWRTPPLRCGVLPGIYRKWLLKQHRVSEQVLTLEQLAGAEALFICNSVRGLRAVSRLVREDAEVIWRPKDPSFRGAERSLWN